MKPKISKIKRVKAWAVYSDRGKAFHSAYRFRVYAKAFIGGRLKGLKIVPCTISFTLPTTHKKK